MKKENWNIILKIMAAVLMISFFIELCGDFYKIHNGNLDIYPFYICIILRILEFIIPSIIIFLSAKYFKDKYNKKGGEKNG